MLTRIDHLVVLVPDLERASGDYEDFGFNVTPGGEHADGLTRNALIPFEDGSYLELVAFLDPDDPRDNVWGWRSFAGSGVGLVDYCVASDDLEADVQRFRERGLTASATGEGGRRLPDGTEIRWRVARFEQSGRVLPFLIEDLTDRALRVPAAPATQHPNGATGISILTLAVPDLSDTELLGSLMEDSEPGPEENRPQFGVGEQLLVPVVPEDPHDPVQQRLDAAGAGPFSATLATSGESRRLDSPGGEILLEPSS